MADFVPLPESGRRYTRTRPVRLGDSSPGGRLRFDGLARYLQDVSNDDTRDAAFENDMAWVVRRTTIEVRSGARFGEEITLTTFASGAGRSWAERRVTVTGSQGAAIEAASLWVHLTDDGRPKSLPDEFFSIYGEALGDRKVSARLTHGEPRPGAEVHPWPLRFTDFDVLEHMNNAAYWSAVEEELSVAATFARRCSPRSSSASRSNPARTCRSTHATATTGWRCGWWSARPCTQAQW